MPTEEFDALVIGAGFAGLYMIHRLRGLGLRARAVEAGDGVGGTWHWNRYPGARCDCPSIHYSYSFSPELEQEWRWSERYAAQPEILAYLNHVADRFDLRRDIQLSTRVTAARYDEPRARWLVETDRGQRLAAQHLICAVGCLSTPSEPRLPGLERFAGPRYHTGRWPHEPVDFAGRRVGVIGTGSSAIQAIPLIAAQAAHLYVFQRTPNFCIPARNRPLPAEELAEARARYREIRAADRSSGAGMALPLAAEPASALDGDEPERARRFAALWGEGGFGLQFAYTDLLSDARANQEVAERVRQEIAAIVRDPQTARRLMPSDHPFGAKRTPLDTDYYATFNRPNVTLVDLREAPLEEITPAGLRAGGADYPLDCLVLATGFDAMTGALRAIDIRGRGGLALRDQWEGGPRTYLGIQSAGFPNMFMITGPGSPSVLSNMPVSIEQHVEWVADCIAHLRARGLSSIEPSAEAEQAWVAHVGELADQTLYPQAGSWYLGANIPGKPRVFMPYVGGVGAYRQRCDEVAARGYEGFVLR